VIRSEACAKDFYSALDAAIDKLESRLRRSADRRRVHHGRHTPISVAAATAAVAAVEFSANGSGGPVSVLEETEEEDLPGQIARAKEHNAKPMTVDQALFEMELVGHDFYLFNDVDTGRASVVYRRRAYDYGVISLAG
jgi:hypothetical protein